MMKTQNSNPSTFSHDDQEDELMDGLAFYVTDSAKTIMSIKHSVYELVNIGIRANNPNRKVNNLGAVVSGSRRNLDDLKRIDSMLKGYLNSRRSNFQEDEEPSEEGVRESTEWSQKMQKIGYSKQIQFYEDEIQRYRQENTSLKDTIAKLQQSNSEVSFNGKNTDKASTATRLKQCDSQIVQTGRNLREITLRNQQCLQLIRKLKREIVYEPEQERQEEEGEEELLCQD